MTSPSPSETPRETPRHSIGVVSRRTGLKPDLIRAWERRYGAVEPARSETRRRRYSDAEIRRLRLLRQAVDGGRNISDVARLPDRELEELIAGDAVAAAAVEARSGGAPAPSPQWTDDREEAARAMLEAGLAAVRALDGQTLQRELDRASVALSRAHLVERLLVPLMERIGDLWQEGTLRPVHEHLASSIVRSFLGGFRGAYQIPHGAPVIVLTTPVRQRHELGALMAASGAAAVGWETLYLGPDLPVEEIAAGAHQSGARVVGLSLTYPPDDPALAGELARLRRLLPPATRIVVGGRAAVAYAAVLDDLGIRRLDSLGALPEALEDLRPTGQDAADLDRS